MTKQLLLTFNWLLISTFILAQKVSKDIHDLNFTKSQFSTLRISPNNDTPYLKFYCNSNVTFYVSTNQLKASLETNKSLNNSLDINMFQIQKKHFTMLID